VSRRAAARRRDESAEGPDPHPPIDEGRLNHGHVDGLVELDHANRTEDANVGDTGQLEAGRQLVAQLSLDLCDALLPGFTFQKIEARSRGRTREWISHEGRAVHQCTRIPRTDGVADPLIRQGCGETQGPAGQGFADADDVGRDVRVIGGEELPAATEARGHFVQDQRDREFVTQAPQAPQIIRRIEPHSARTLNDGFEDHRCKLVAVSGQLLRQVRDVPLLEGLVEAAGRALGEDVLFERRTEEIVHAADRIADRHRGKGIAVVTAPYRQQATLLGLPLCEPILPGHLDCDLDRNRTRIA